MAETNTTYIPVISPTGEKWEVPESELQDSLDKGFKVDKPKTKIEQFAEDHPAITAATTYLSKATELGGANPLAPIIQTGIAAAVSGKSWDEAKKGIKEIDEQSPRAALAGEITGTVAAALAPSPFGKVGAVGRLASILGRGGVGGKVLSSALTHGVAGAADAALMETGTQFTSLAMGDEDITAERVLGSLGSIAGSTALGAGLGGVLGGAGRAGLEGGKIGFAATYSKATDLLKKAPAQAVKDSLLKRARLDEEKLILKNAFGLSDREIKAIAKADKDAIIKEVFDSGYLPSSPEAIRTARRKSAAEIDKLQAQIREIEEKHIKSLKIEDLRHQTMEASALGIDKTESPAEIVADALSALRNQGKRQDMFLALNYNNKFKEVKDVPELMKFADRLMAEESLVLQNAGVKLRDSVYEALPGDLGAQYKALVAKSKLTSDVHKMLGGALNYQNGKAGGEEIIEWLQALQKTPLALSVDLFTGGLPLATIFSIVPQVINKLKDTPRGSVFLAKMQRKLSGEADKNALDIVTSIDVATKLKPVKDAVGHVPTVTRKLVNEFVRQSVMLDNTNKEIKDGRAAAVFSQTDPKLAAAISIKQAEDAQYLKQLRDNALTTDDAHKFVKTSKTLRAPQEAIRKLKDGVLEPTLADILNNRRPELKKQITNQAITSVAELAEKGEAPQYDTRIQLSIISDVTFDKTMDPKYIALAQKTWASIRAKQDEAAQSVPPSMPSPPSRKARDLRTGAERLEED